jgi:pectin methylesterase-like acyl-CoA thioesterase
VCAEEINSTEQINIVEDDNLTNSITVSGNSFDDIQKTIDKSNKHDIIELNGTYTPNNKVIVIKKPITIQGSENGAILNANNLDNVFEIEATM